MKKLKKALKQINWKYSIREIILIVTGILIALALNNWNDALKQQEDEISTLKELRHSLQNDLDNIEDVISTYQLGDQSIDLVINHLKAGKPYNDSLKVHFANTVMASLFLEDRGTYETLTYKGREIISNNELRLGLASLYSHDYKYLKKVEEIDYNHLVNNVVPYYSRNFKNFQFGQSATPVDYNKLMNDDFYFGLLEWLKTDRIFLLQRYEGTRKKVSKLIAMIDEEIEAA